MMEIQPEAKPIYLIGLDTSAQYDRKRKTSMSHVFGEGGLLQKYLHLITEFYIWNVKDV